MIEFVTYDEHAAQMYPPKPAIQAAPEWFKRTPISLPRRAFANIRLRRDTTIRGCPAVQDYLNLGYMLPMPYDLIVTAVPEGFKWDIGGNPELVVEDFSPGHWPEFPRKPGDHNYVIKFPTPWLVKTPPGWSTLVVDCWYHQEERFTPFNGIVDTDRFGVMSPVCIWHAPIGETVMLKAGTPLAHLIPFKRPALEHSIAHDPERWQALRRQCETVVPEGRLAPGTYREHGRSHSNEQP